MLLGFGETGRRALDAVLLSTASQQHVYRVLGTAVLLGDPEEDKTTHAYRIESGGVFNLVTRTALQQVPAALDFHLEVAAPKPGRNAPLPTTAKKWKKLKPAVKTYVNAILTFISQLAEPSMIAYVLRHTVPLCPYIACKSRCGCLTVTETEGAIGFGLRVAR